MNERIHRYLDGELKRGNLTPADLEHVEALEDIVHETERTHQSIRVPDLTAQVMARLAAEGPPGHAAPNTSLRHALNWLWAPRAVRIRPAWGILATAALLLIVVLPWGATPPAPAAPGISARATATGSVPDRVFVQFRLDAPAASTVRLAGSFTEWEPTYTLHQMTPGIWSILVPLAPGVHDYNFVVNGDEWVPDPAAPFVNDGFGGVNSRLSVLLPENFSSQL